MDAQAFPSLVRVDEGVPRFRDSGGSGQSLRVFDEREDVQCEFGGERVEEVALEAGLDQREEGREREGRS